ncbi:MAG TPA: hypothetical protein VFH47_00410 [Candidatus Thermoplasmatota archaeon]|nr:hypothetical protein [Candidatus Thermoplasmatota archaeon]
MDVDRPAKTPAFRTTTLECRTCRIVLIAIESDPAWEQRRRSFLGIHAHPTAPAPDAASSTRGSGASVQPA